MTDLDRQQQATPVDTDDDDIPMDEVIDLTMHGEEDTGDLFSGDDDDEEYFEGSPPPEWEIDPEEEEEFMDDYSDDVSERLADIVNVLGDSLTDADTGETACTALMSIAHQLSVQNKIMIKILAKLT